MSLVFLDYDQAGLDAAYDQRIFAPNMAAVLQRYASRSDAARRRIGEPRDHAYGATAIERLEAYVPGGASDSHGASADASGASHSGGASGAPVFVFLHGGAWRAGLARNYAFVAETFVRAGACVVIPDFAAVQDADGDLRVLVDQVRRAIVWTYRNAASFGGEGSRLYLGGHSSGAHLAAACLVTDWTAFGLPADCIKGALCSSGVYDLRPVRLSARNAYVRLDDEIEHALSAQRHAARVRAPLIVSHGTQESPEFIRQAHEFTASVRLAGGAAELVVGHGYNHFEILETLGDPQGTLGHAMLRLMKLG